MMNAGLMMRLGVSCGGHMCRTRSVAPPALRRQQVFVSRKRVIRLMQEYGLVARVRRRYRCTTMSRPRPAGGRQPARSNLHRGSTESESGGRHYRTHHSLGKALPGRHRRSLLAFRVGRALSAATDRHGARLPDTDGVRSGNPTHPRRLNQPVHGIRGNSETKDECLARSE